MVPRRSTHPGAEGASLWRSGDGHGVDGARPEDPGHPRAPGAASTHGPKLSSLFFLCLAVF